MANSLSKVEKGLDDTDEMRRLRHDLLRELEAILTEMVEWTAPAGASETMNPEPFDAFPSVNPTRRMH